VSLRQAVNAKCKSCIYDPLAEGTWRAQTGACPVTICAFVACAPDALEAASREGPS